MDCLYQYYLSREYFFLTINARISHLLDNGSFNLLAIIIHNWSDNFLRIITK